jgi:hypothetical protein
LRKTEEIMKQESEAKAKGETFMPDSALGMFENSRGSALFLLC